MPGLYPISLNIQGRRCLVVGGGEVAERKIIALLECGAAVTVVDVDLSQVLGQLAQEGAITHLARLFREEDLAGVMLVVSATDNQEVNRQVARECGRRGILVNVVDQPAMCSYYVPAVVRQGNLTISVSTNGRSPLLAGYLRERLQAEYGPEYSVLLELLGEARQDIINKFPDPAKRRRAFRQLVASDLLELIRRGEEERVKERITECTSS